MKKYPSLRYPGEQETVGLFSEGTVLIQEKLDGANFRFKRDGDELVFGSRRTEGEGMNKDQFEDPIEFVRERVDEAGLLYVEEMFGQPVVYFGEAMMPHTLSYEWADTPGLVGFDVWLTEDEEFAEPRQAKKAFGKIDVPFAPILDVIEASEWDEYDFEVPQSAYGDVQAEGVVFKNPDTETYGKYVREDFKEKNKQKFGASSKKELSDTQLLAEEYVPPARVRSVAHKLVDEGDTEWTELKMEMMRDLPEAVIRDMADEEAGNIFMEESKEIDIGDFRSEVSSRCAAVLRQMIDEKIQEEL